MKYLIFLIFSLSLYGKDTGLVLSAFIKDEWKIVVYEDKLFKIIETELEPRTFDYDFINQQIIYIASDKTLRLKDKDSESIVLSSNIDAYTQPMFTSSGKNVIMIKLIDGNSINTNIISYNLKSKNIKTIVSQRSTQLEPYILNDTNLYYSNVSCVEDCGKIIQEIWYKHILSGDAYQLTLTNSISHQPSVDSDQKNIYFSSNKNGFYHIWKMDLNNNKYTQLTDGEVTDGYPMPTKKGDVIFIRKDGNKNMLMKINKNNKLTELKLPKEYKKIRSLKVQR